MTCFEFQICYIIVMVYLRLHDVMRIHKIHFRIIFNLIIFPNHVDLLINFIKMYIRNNITICVDICIFNVYFFFTNLIYYDCRPTRTLIHCNLFPEKFFSSRNEIIIFYYIFSWWLFGEIIISKTNR